MSKLIRTYASLTDLPSTDNGAVASVAGVLYVRTGGAWVLLGTIGVAPHLLSGCRLALASDSGITLNGATVSAWADQSGLGNNAAQATAANQPTYTASDAAFNGLPSLTFDGTNDSLACTGVMTATGTAVHHTILVVGRITSGATDGVLASVGAASAVGVIAASTGWWAGGAGLSVPRGGDKDTGVTHAWAKTYAGSASMYSLWLDRWAIIQYGTTGAYAAVNLTTTGAHVGSLASGTYLNGKIACVYAFSRALDAVEISAALTYLRAKYGIAV
jgi:hypothetical protein